VITSIVILAVSLGLFLYWFRYTCLLILSAKTSRDYAREVAESNGLGFVNVQKQLPSLMGSKNLDPLQVSLQRDYEVVSGLMRHASDLKVSGFPLEDVMLRVDFFVMRSWYAAARSLAPKQAAVAVGEMCQIVSYFANTMGERSFCGDNA
jgi:hypothetical protein